MKITFWIEPADLPTVHKKEKRGEKERENVTKKELERGRKG
jgi:hypothetical protein